MKDVFRSISGVGVIAATMLLMATAAPAARKDPMPHDARAVIASVEAVSPGGIDEHEAVKIGGIRQWISVRGNNPANPILLFVHGGPGSPMMGESWAYQRPWEDYFTVVQWDQRGAGKTFSLAGRKPDRSMSIAEMVSDTEDLIQYLRRRYGKRKIFLLGHSWGSILGVEVAQAHPEWLYAYIGVGQVVNMRKNEAVGYQLTLERARALGNMKAVKELESIAPYPDRDGSITQSKTGVERKWDTAFGGMLYGHSTDDEWGRWALSPQYSEYDVASARLGEESTNKVLWPQLAAVNFDDVVRFGCPVFIFAGAEDRTTPASLAQAWYRKLQAPRKRLFLVRASAHYVFMERPGVFLVDLVRYVRPLANGGNGH